MQGNQTIWGVRSGNHEENGTVIKDLEDALGTSEIKTVKEC